MIIIYLNSLLTSWGIDLAIASLQGFLHVYVSVVLQLSLKSALAGLCKYATVKIDLIRPR